MLKKAIFVWKKNIRAEGFVWKKKFLHKQWAKKKILQAENSPKREKGFWSPEKANY